MIKLAGFHLRKTNMEPNAKRNNNLGEIHSTRGPSLPLPLTTLSLCPPLKSPLSPNGQNLLP